MTPSLQANVPVSTADCAIFGVLVVDADIMGTILDTAMNGMSGVSIGIRISGSRGKLRCTMMLDNETKEQAEDRMIERIDQNGDATISWRDNEVEILEDR